MHYVKQFHINGVDTKQVACIELHGKPNAATEGAVGVLGMDITSPTHEVYKCVAVNGSVYTWELLSAGMSIMSSTDTGEGGLIKTFSYTSLLCAEGYLIKRGDLILDSKGYLYRVTAIGAESCDTEYCGTHIGGIASGDKDYMLTVGGGKLKLVTESGAVVSEIDTVVADNETLYRDIGTKKTYVMGVRTVNDQVLRFFVGTKEEYEALTEVQKKGLFAIITNDTTKDDILRKLEILDAYESGATPVAKANKLSLGEYKSGQFSGRTSFDLDRGTVYFVMVRYSDYEMNCILPVGGSSGYYMSSPCSGGSGLYQVHYEANSSGGDVVYLTKDTNMVSGGYSAYFFKIADYPSV